MMKTTTILLAIALCSILFTGCERLRNRDDSSQVKSAAVQAIDEIITSLDDLTKTQASQIDATDADLLIPSDTGATKEDKTNTAQAVETLLASLNELPKALSSQTDAADFDLLIP